MRYILFNECLTYLSVSFLATPSFNRLEFASPGSRLFPLHSFFLQ